MPLNGPLKTLLLRGLLAGLIGGLLAGVVGYVLGEPHIDAAIAIEEAGHAHDDVPLVSRTGQQAGLFLASGLAGIALGAIFGAVAYGLSRHVRLSGPALALMLAAGGWLAIEAVPFGKYPANPPAVGDPDTIDQRTLLWLAALILGLAAVGTAAYLCTVLRAQPATVRALGALAAFLVVVTLGYVLLPGVNEVPDDFPATLLWQFRLSSLATQATLWAGLGLAFAYLTERADTPVRGAPTTVG